MSNPRKKIIYDSTLTNALQVDANNAAAVHILDASGDPYFTSANPGEVTATDLDIRDLDSATDSVEAVQSVAADLNATVVATDLDIRDLTSASDDVSVTTVKPDGANTMPSMDAIARAGFQKITDGVTTVGVDTDGQMHVTLDGKLDTNNQTTTPLGIAGVFTGTATRILAYGGIGILVGSDASGVLQVQFSPDGSDWHEGESYTIIAGSDKFFTPPTWSVYYRLIYTNGGVAQTTFYIHPVIKKTAFKWSSHNIAEAITSEDDAELVKAVITGIDDNGIFRNAEISVSGRQKVVSQPYGYAVAEGDLLNHAALLKFGTRTSVAANTQSLIWEGTNALYTYLTSAEQLKITSTDNVNDNVGGTGALTLTLIGLDANYDELEETITMTGTTAVTTTASFIRIFRAYVATSGTSYSNTGTITVTNNAATIELAKINIGESQTLMTMWTVPAGYTFYITNGTFSTNSNKGARVSLFTRQLDGGTLYPWRIRYRAYAFSGNENFPFGIPFQVPEKTDLEVRVNTPGSAGTTSCGATFDGWYELN